MERNVFIWIVILGAVAVAAFLLGRCTATPEPTPTPPATPTPIPATPAVTPMATATATVAVTATPTAAATPTPTPITPTPTATVAVTATAEVVVTPEPTATVVPMVALTTGCPNDTEFYEIVGVRADQVGGEPCLFHWRADPLTMFAKVPCPEGWVCTLGIVDHNGQRKTVVVEGDKNLPPLEIFAGSWRMRSAYPPGDPIHDKCAFLQKVQEFAARENPPWTPEPLNFNCP